MIRNAEEKDHARICEIYNHYILTSIATAEELTITPEEMGERIKKVQKKFPWTIFEEDGNVIGYAYATDWRPRYGYRFTAETSVYLDPNTRSKGVGSRLYIDLFERLRRQSIRQIIGVIALPNDASVALHEKFGFKRVGYFEQVNYKFDHWIDVGYWQLTLDNLNAGSV